MYRNTHSLTTLNIKITIQKGLNMNFRAIWTINRIRSIREYYHHRKTLTNPWRFYLIVFLKIIPKLYTRPLNLNLRNGSHIVIRDFMSMYIYHEIFIIGCYDAKSFEIDNPTIIEVGANTGLFVLRIKNNYPAAKIISFEPHPDNYLSLLETIKINNLNNIFPIKKAVSHDSNGSKLFIHPKNMGGHSLYKEQAGDKYISIETTTVESIFSDYNIESCDLLKLDCEGSEYNILKTLTPTLSKKIHSIIYEPTHRKCHIDLTDFLNKLGYTIKMHKGLVVAMMPQKDTQDNKSKEESI